MRVKNLFVILIASFLTIGCGGGGSDVDIELAKLISGKTFYEADNKKAPKYYTHRIDANQYVIKAYNDPDFSDLNSSKSKTYQVIKFEKEDFEIKVNGIVYISDYVYYEDVEGKKITEFGISFTPKDQDEADSENLFLLKAYPTKEEALNNMN